MTVETCPHYLSLTAEEVSDGDTRFKCCPPVREADNRDALWEGLAAGVIDMVVSDHSPCTAELKRLDPADPGCGDFGLAWGGIASLQLGLPVVWTEARRRGHDLAEVVKWMAQRSAELVGMARKAASPGGPTRTWWSSPRTRPSPWGSGTTATRSPPTPGASSSGSCGAPGCAGSRWTLTARAGSCSPGGPRESRAWHAVGGMTDFRQLPDLARRDLGGSVIWANDEGFAPKENLIMPRAAVFDPGTFGHHGKIYDGW